MPNIDAYLDANAARFEEELCELLRIPSVSADPSRREAIGRAAAWVSDQFQRLGFATELIPTAGCPLVYAESPEIDGAPTVLVYGHYDVQPPEPLELWITPPFEPARRQGNLYARGATDDKGQLFTHIKSAEAWIHVERRLPINLKYLIEGEEEVGSGNLEAFLKTGAKRLACNCIVISDGAQFAPGQPAITCGLRGIAYYEIRLDGPAQDLHSGSFGGSVANPANALATMLAAIVDKHGRIQVPGFYDDVVAPSKRERRQLAQLPFDEAAYMKELGVSALAGEEGYSTLERRWVRPTFDICGLTSGYQGQWAKTIVPATATAKFSFRLVPNQDPAKVACALRAMLEGLCPPGIRMQLTEEHGGRAVGVSLDSPYVLAAARAIEHAFERPPLYTREGGSIPIVAAFQEALHADVLLLGWGQNDDNTHSPNEKICLADFHRGIKASARLWEEMAGI